MSEFLLRFSLKNRQKSGVSFSHDFTTKFNEPIKLSYDEKHEIAVRTISILYYTEQNEAVKSWDNGRFRSPTILYRTERGR